MPDSVYSYSKRLDRALRWGWSYTWPNKGAWQASLVLKHAYKYAKDQIRVFSRDLDSEIYCGESKFEFLHKFLAKRTAKFEILVAEELSPSHEIWSLAEVHPDQVSIKIVSPGSEDMPQADFMVVDDFGIRQERDREKRSALVCFNEPAAAELIASYNTCFDELAATAIPHPRT